MYIDCKTGAREFSAPLDKQDVKSLLSGNNNRLIVLWTMQQPGFIDRLREEEHLVADPDFTFGKFDGFGKRGAYEWLQGEWRARMPNYEGNLPIWTSLIRPDFTTRDGDKLLKLHVMQSRILFLWYLAWEPLLHFMADPFSEFPLPGTWCNPFPAKLENIGLPSLSRTEVIASHSEMFDLHLAEKPGFLWIDGPIVLQGVIEKLAREDVVDTGDIRLRERWFNSI